MLSSRFSGLFLLRFGPADKRLVLVRLLPQKRRNIQVFEAPFETL